MVISTLHDYAERKLKPEYLRELDEKDEFPTQVLKDLYDPDQFGLHLLFIPEEYGGLGGGAYDIYRVSEAMAADRPGHRHRRAGHLPGHRPDHGGRHRRAESALDGQDRRRGAAGGLRRDRAAGRQRPGALTTRAEPVEEDGQVVGYRITGRKQWISNGGVADLYTILAIAPGGPSWFIVEHDAPGFTKGKPEDKHGIRASNTAALFLEDVYVPADRLVGGVEGQGLAQAQAVFGYTRLMVGAFGLGARLGGAGARDPLFADSACRAARR